MAKIKVYKLSPGGGFNPIVFSDEKALLREIEDLVHYSEIGDEVLVELDEMDKDKFKNLPEHQGW